MVDGIRFLNVSAATGAFPTGERTIGILTLDAGRADLEKIELGA